MNEPLSYSESIHIDASPAAVYAAVADVTRMGEWSPVCRECWWDEGDGPRVGAWFTGHNVNAERDWQTRCRVTVADEGRAFGWNVGPGVANWTYTMQEQDGGTLLTEAWEFPLEGQETFATRFGDDAPAQIADREAAAHSGVAATLAAMKRVIEQG